VKRAKPGLCRLPPHGSAVSGRRHASIVFERPSAARHPDLGWGVAQFPYLLPKPLKISQGAAPSDTLTMTLIVFGAAVPVVLPALGLPYALAQRGLVSESEGPRPAA
jgi:hypothetical protein